MRPIRMIASFLTVGFWTLMSRVLGLARDILFAAYLGSGPVGEAFWVAFSLPNMFRRFFAEGAFNMAFVPMFSKKHQAGEDAQAFAQEAMSGLVSILFVLTVVAFLAMPVFVFAMASGFYGDERFDLAVTYGRIAFPYILFISLAALLSGVLNATGRFAAAAAAPLLLNVILCAVMVWVARTGADIGVALAWGVLVAGVAQLTLVWVAAARAGYRLIPSRPRLSPEMKRLAMIAFPAVLAAGVVQVNLLVGRQVASHSEAGSITWLMLADRINQLPLGVVAIAIGIVLLPDLSRRLAAGDSEGGRNAFNRAFEFALMLTVPAAVAFVIVPMPIISVIYERGAFGADDVAYTAVTLAIYALGLPAFVIQKVLQPLYFAREDTRSPLRYALVAMVVNAVIAIGLMPFIGFLAAAFATTVAGWIMVWQLWRGSRGMGEAAQTDTRLRRRVWRIILAALLMGCVLWAGQLVLFSTLAPSGHDTLALVLLVLLGLVSYFGLGHLIGAFRLSELRQAVRRS